MTARSGRVTEDRTASAGSHPHALPARMEFPGQAAQVPLARRFVAQAIGGCPASGDAPLLTSELVANALRHTASGTGGRFTVLVEHVASAIRVTVTDDGAPTGPALARHDGLAQSGRGLALVEAMSARWGHGGDEHSRSVWFEIGCP